MSYRVVQGDILLQQTDAVAISIEIDFSPSEMPSCLAVAAAGGDGLRRAIRALRFVSVGRAAEADAASLPFSRLIVTAAPVWLTGKANELLMLHYCYQNIFDLAEDSGCRSIAMPFFSALYYRFPKEEAVKIALREAKDRPLDVIFVADTPELYEICQKPYRKPVLGRYIGYYRDHALFELDNGLFARVDIRPEVVDVTPISYFEPCFRIGSNPRQPALPEDEIARLRQIYEDNDW